MLGGTIQTYRKLIVEILQPRPNLKTLKCSQYKYKAVVLTWLETFPLKFSPWIGNLLVGDICVPFWDSYTFGGIVSAWIQGPQGRYLGQAVVFPHWTHTITGWGLNIYTTQAAKRAVLTS